MKTPLPRPASTALGDRFAAFDLLATLVAVVGRDGVVLFANAALEDRVQARGVRIRSLADLRAAGTPDLGGRLHASSVIEL